MKIGFIGQGFVGKNIANNFVARGYNTVRYALESEYVGNKDLIAGCDIVFIAVPTPTTPEGFDYSIVKEAISLVGVGKTAVVKSTLVPGTTRVLQDAYPDRVVLCSPEFLSEVTAVFDAAHPSFTIVGIPYDAPLHRRQAQRVLEVLPSCPHNFIVRAQAAELVKYAHNVHGYMRVILSNILYDAAQAVGADWADMKLIMDADPSLPPYYNVPVHKGGRGAGGNCFVKDMAAFRMLFESVRGEDVKSIAILKALEAKNLELLAMTGKSRDIVRGVYGASVPNEKMIDEQAEKESTLDKPDSSPEPIIMGGATTTPSPQDSQATLRDVLQILQTRELAETPKRELENPFNKKETGKENE